MKLTPRINDLFDEWDVDKFGYLDKTEILSVLSQWQKNSTKSYNIEMCRFIYPCDLPVSKNLDFRTLVLSSFLEFQVYLLSIIVLYTSIIIKQ